MGRCSFSNAKLISAIVVESLTRRGFASLAPQSVVSSSIKRGVAKKSRDKESPKTSPWVPDPKTGFYRPESHANDINVAELHEALLNNKIRRH